MRFYHEEEKRYEEENSKHFLILLFRDLRVLRGEISFLFVSFLLVRSAIIIAVDDLRSGNKKTVTRREPSDGFV